MENAAESDITSSAENNSGPDTTAAGASGGASSNDLIEDDGPANAESKDAATGDNDNDRPTSPSQHSPPPQAAPSQTSVVVENDANLSPSRGTEAPPPHAFRRGAGPLSSSSPTSEDDSGGTALTKLKQWFSSSHSSPAREENNGQGGDYHNFSSPERDREGSEEKSGGGASAEEKQGASKTSLDDNQFDESLLDNQFDESMLIEEGKEGDVEPVQRAGASTSPKKRSWGKKLPSPSDANAGGGTLREEERVMGECSFFYDMDDVTVDGVATPKTAHRSSHLIPETEPPLNNEEAEEGYVEQSSHRPHYRKRRMLHLAQEIKTRAKRRWTERRYRRRLRQSQLGLPRHSWSGAPADPNDRSPRTGGAHDSAYELTAEHRRAFNAAHAALNGEVANEYGRNRHAIRRQYGYEEYDLDYDLDLEEAEGGRACGEDEIRADLTRSSLAIRGGLIRLPADNVRLVCDARLQPGILSIETRDVRGAKEGEGGGSGVVGYENYSNANRYGNIHGSGMAAAHEKNSSDGRRPRSYSRESLSEHHNAWSRHELAYVLTVDEQIYRRVVREMGDSYCIPCGMYYCCHESRSGDHVGIGVAVCVLLGVFLVLVLGMIAWPTW